MIDGNGYEWTTQKGSYIKMEDPYGNYVDGKSGNGYARITLLEDPSQNNLLKEIQINKGQMTPEVNYDDTEYTIEVGPEDTEITIYGVVDDITAQIEGNGTYDVLPGENKVELKVTAENGDVRTYTITIKREASSNSKPINITIDGLIESIININPEKYGHLVPEQFDSNVHEYSMVVPSRLKKLIFNVEKGHKYQTVTGDGQVTLNPGENIIEISVTSEDGKSTDKYTYRIERDMSGNCMLESLSIKNIDEDIEFDQDILEYYIIVPNEITDLEIEAIPEVKTLTPIIIGDKNLDVGLNDVYIIINAENGEQLVYIIHVYRMMSGNTFLSSLKVLEDQEELPLTPEFNKILDTYTITVPNKTNTVNIVATPEVSTTKVAGAGQKDLKTGINVFTITTTAQDGSQDTYTISIEREKSNNNYLSSLSTQEGEFVESFDRETQEYHIEVESNVNYLNLSYEKEDETATVQVIGNRNFVAGDNEITIKVIAENGEIREYKIIATRKKSENNYLELIWTDHGELDPKFDRETTEYTVEVENEVEIINVNAKKEDDLSTVTGTGKYALQVGDNYISISVMSESGEIRTYNLNVIRKLNSNKNLITIDNDKNAEVTRDGDTFRIKVPNETNKIKIKGIPEVKTTIVTSGDGEKTLEVGENTYTLTVEAEDGTTKDYTVIIDRAKSSNANLKFLFIEESNYTPKLDKDVTEYYAKILAGVEKLTMTIEAEDEGATYEVIGNQNFVDGENRVTIRVTASDGVTQKDYIINAFRQVSNTGSNYLYVLTVDKGTLTPDFNKDIQVYEVTVPYEVTNIEVGAITEDSMAQLKGTGTYPLEVGLNVISVTVTSTDGIDRVYQIKVTREKSSEARLKSLEIEGHEYTPEFEPDIMTYYVETNNLSLDIKAETLDANATYEIIGNENFVKGINEVTIRVTAPDGKTTCDYKIIVTRKPSYNNNLESLKVVGYELVPEFNKSTLVYEVNVEATVNKVNVEAIPEEAVATVSGTGIITVNTGRNVISVTVTSEAGTQKTYTVIVNKGESDNNYLEKLLVSDGTLNPSFDREINNYTLEVEYETNDLYVLGYAEDNTATVTGNGLKQLEVGDNTIKLEVTAENGAVRTYTINVVRKPAVSALLKKLEAKGYNLTPIFDMNTKSYSVTVDNEVTQLDLLIETLDPKATYTVTGNKDFVVGMNQVRIDVLSSNGIDTETYYINVNRQIYSNNYLSYILPSKGTLSPSFVKTQLNYEIVVNDDVDSIYIDAEPKDANATVDGVKTYTLNKGKNIVNLKVTSALGITRTYTITIIRNKNSNANLSKLEVKNGQNIVEITPKFDKDCTEYTLEVEEGTSRLNIIAEAEHELSTVSGAGYISLTAGENRHNITVTAEDGTTKTYLLIINRAKSSNNYLTDLIPSIGVLLPSFSYDQTEYTIIAKNTDALLSFEYNTENRYATVTGVEAQIIPDGTSTRTIIVTAEDGSTRTYTVTVIKNRTDDARLKHLEVSGYTFEEEFNEDKYVYTLYVPNEVTVFNPTNVIADPKYETSTVYLDGQINLTTKKTNVFKIKVLAEDGFTTQIYQINIIRAKNDNNNLSSLEVRIGEQGYDLTPDFEKDILEYTVTLQEGTKNIEILATPENIEATVEGIGEHSIEIGENEIDITVTAENGNIKTYKVKAIRPANTNTNLENIVPSIGTLKPEFNKNILKYTVEVENEDYYISFDVTPENILSTVTGADETYIEDGENVREIVVTAEDGSTKTYEITVIKNRTNDPRLKSLAVKSFELDQEFDSDLFEYTLTVPNDKFEITENEIVAKPKYEGSTLEYTGTIELSVLEINKYQIKVTSPDGTRTATYTINITRKKSSDSSLSSLTVTGYKIKEEFNSKILEYTVLVPKGTQTLEAERVIPIPTDQYASIEKSGDLDLSRGQKTFNIVVTSHDETTTTTYKINVEFAKSDNAYLKTLEVTGGTLSPEFSRETTIYDVYMTEEQDTLTIFAEPEDEYAVIEEGTGEITITDTNKQILIKVKAEDESYRIYILNVTKEPKQHTKIKGNIITENTSNEHIASIKVYKDISLLQEISTKQDGSYEISVIPGKYTIVISKEGYLDLTIESINVQTIEQEIKLDTYKLIAGDVAEDGRINIDDLVDMNDNYGEVITEENKSEKGIYDLNEDGTVDMKDRDILKKNYGKKAETVQWGNPEATNEISLVGESIARPSENFVLPLSSTYRISSEYGYRIHPITGEKKLHAGIDLVGEHNGEILSVADGVVIYAGEQNGYGNCIEIKHIVNGEAIYSFYAHLSKIDVKVGEKVNKGQVIGLEGGAETDEGHGTSTGHHLHFELRTASGSGHSVDPTKYIQF